MTQRPVLGSSLMLGGHFLTHRLSRGCHTKPGRHLVTQRLARGFQTWWGGHFEAQRLSLTSHTWPGLQGLTHLLIPARQISPLAQRRTQRSFQGSYLC